MTTSTGSALGMNILMALNLPRENVRRIKIDLEAGSVATMTIYRYLTDDEGKRVSEEFKTYHLVDADGAEDEP